MAAQRIAGSEGISISDDPPVTPVRAGDVADNGADGLEVRAQRGEELDGRTKDVQRRRVRIWLERGGDGNAGGRLRGRTRRRVVVQG